MCGLAGILQTSGTTAQCDINSIVQRMCLRMQLRGPDAVDYWHDSNARLSLGHRRLSVIDLEARSNQPMHSDCERYTIVYNGEIYNFRELRKDLECSGEIFRTQSDTEVILKLYIREGEAMLQKLRGMFAIAIWDRETRTVFLARDPYGIKPLYMAKSKDGWLFASQVKALLASKIISQDPDYQGQASFWLLGSVAEPRTWFRDISALPAGSWTKISDAGECDGPHKYWDIGDAWREAPDYQMSLEDAQERVKIAVSESVRQHLVADVPVGVFLSGGIDSGSMAGLIKDSGATDVQGITIAFKEFEGNAQNEVPVAAQVANAYGIKHHVRTVTREEFESDLPRILSAMDQPSIDGVNTWYASKAVAELGLKVVISGVGGDELFYGYPSFQQLPKLVSRVNRLKNIPGLVQLADMALSVHAQRSGNTRWRWLTRQADSLYGAYWLRRGLFSPDELPALMGVDNELFRSETPNRIIESMAGGLATDSMAAVGQLESMAYLRNQLLRDSDWASMDHSVELRTPLVDAWLLRDLIPVLRSFGHYKGKELLAASPIQPLKRDVVTRSKTGFGIPLGIWLEQMMHESSSSVRHAPNQGGSDSRRWASILSSEVYKQ